MKKLALILITIITSRIYAQETIPAIKLEGEGIHQKKGELYYCCPKLDYCNSKPGVCHTHNMNLIKVGEFCCDECNTTSEKPCTCPKCGKDMKEMKEIKPTDVKPLLKQ